MQSAPVKIKKQIKELHRNVEDVDSEWLRNELIQAKRKFVSEVESGKKDLIQEAHIAAKLSSDAKTFSTLRRLANKHSRFLIEGANIDPEKISPRLVEVTPNSLEEKLFRIARSTWSMPHSKGYGRRLRFLLIDDYHEALIGVIGLQSPPADLKCRDDLVKSGTEKLSWVNATMDAYTVGAIGPYRGLLGGKLVAGALCCTEIQKAYWRKYGGAETVMEKRVLSQPLLAITTASAFGRSSIYNRLKFGNRLIAEPIGYTRGFGCIHIEHLYPSIALYLESRGELQVGGFGNGPKVRWQNIQNVAKLLGLPHDTLSHGLKRQVFLFKHSKNFSAAAAGAELPDPWTYGFDEWAEYWTKRYCIPRSNRTEHYKQSSTIKEVMRALSDE